MSWEGGFERAITSLRRSPSLWDRVRITRAVAQPNLTLCLFSLLRGSTGPSALLPCYDMTCGSLGGSQEAAAMLLGFPDSRIMRW